MHLRSISDDSYILTKSPADPAVAKVLSWTKEPRRNTLIPSVDLQAAV